MQINPPDFGIPTRMQINLPDIGNPKPILADFGILVEFVIRSRRKMRIKFQKKTVKTQLNFSRLGNPNIFFRTNQKEYQKKHLE